MRDRLERRLSAYWKMEAANVVVVPAFAAWMVLQAGGAITWPLVLAMIADSALLVVGAIAWRMELAGLRGERDFAPALLPWLARAQVPTLLISVASVGGAVFEVWRGGWSPAAIATCVLAALAMLEYVNYYVVQLQHFDHAADFKRLMSGRGFREAHLAKALRAYRKRA
jgi:hypothetical protein